ncbi:enoyl-CoA hydratase/isomerase family protein [Nocardia paucivorans]|uniref:enoyl-CoA hydratase/isomerase family protein n=1 Tax=Nocardia paucivorans TaxID=114259 RepID=UPI00031B7447|nr:enoyl-CoA hydratase/isomerase family protein [Nocardia paucivorans]
MTADRPAILLRRAEPVAFVTIRNPAKRNALTVDMLDELDTVLARLRNDRSIRAVVLNGAAGDFSSGMDIDELRSARVRGIALEHRMTAAEERLAAFPKAVIAAIEGYCVGGGAQLAMACDLRVAGRAARFGVTPAKLGIVYPSATVARLTRILGPATAKRLIFTAELIDADTALRIGLVGEITASADPVPRAVELAELVCSRSSVSVAAAKEMIDTGVGDIDDAGSRYRDGLLDADALEGIDAFLTGRMPRFGARPG